jgi:hypothetical protein
VRDGAQELKSWPLRQPAEATRLRQLWHGFWLPVVLARAVLADDRVRRRWLRYSAGQEEERLVDRRIKRAGKRLVETLKDESSRDETAWLQTRRERGATEFSRFVGLALDPAALQKAAALRADHRTTKVQFKKELTDQVVQLKQAVRHP